MNISTIKTRQILSDYQTLKAELVQKNETAETNLGEFKIDDFFSRVDDDPNTKDLLMATRNTGDHITLLSFEEKAEQGDLQLKFKWIRTDLSEPGIEPEIKEAVISSASGRLLSEEGNGSLDIVA